MIYFDTNCNAPGCIGRIVDEESGRDVLIQTDWDQPSVASTFGWSPSDVQTCQNCGGLVDERNGDECECHDCDYTSKACDHRGTDGTVDCPGCGLKASRFIEAAGGYLDGCDGQTADDPGYFD